MLVGTSFSQVSQFLHFILIELTNTIDSHQFGTSLLLLRLEKNITVLEPYRSHTLFTRICLLWLPPKNNNDKQSSLSATEVSVIYMITRAPFSRNTNQEQFKILIKHLMLLCFWRGWSYYILSSISVIHFVQGGKFLGG